jgi:hypothetical protein
MAIDWNEYELVLEEDSSKECEVTGRDMGGIDRFTCPVSDLIEGKSPHWTPENCRDSYGGYQSYTFYFLRADEEAVHLYTDKHYRQDIDLKPGETWTSGWYSFGEWSYCVSLQVSKKNKQ